MKYCVFQIYAPLVSWGDIAIGIERRTFSHPSKSAIVGLIAAAFGIKREEEERNNLLADTLGFGIKMISPGIIIRDFHTAQVPENDKKARFYTRKDEMTLNPDKIGTVLSKREYSCDSLIIIAVWVKNEEPSFKIENIKTAIQSPVYHLYFGRKSSPPGLPLHPEIIEAKDMKSALDLYKVNSILGLSSISKGDERKKYLENFEKRIFFEYNPIYYWEENTLPGMDYTQKTIRYDKVLSRKRWQFAPRNEFMSISKMEGENVH